jgi:hypothetical protein
LVLKTTAKPLACTWVFQNWLLLLINMITWSHDHLVATAMATPFIT